MVILEPIGHTMETGHCYVCYGTKLITDSHSCELICANCGLVISNRVEDYEATKQGKVELKRKLQKQPESQR